MKKGIALLLALMLVFSCALCTASAAGSEKTFPDLEGAATIEAVNALYQISAINGFPDGTFGQDQTLTRAQAAKIFMLTIEPDFRVAGAKLAGAAEKAAAAFSDITEAFWGAGYIGMALDAGVVAGYPDGTFLPNKDVTFYEMVRMGVTAAGMQPTAASGDAWYTPYMNAAKGAGLLWEGAGANGNAPATRGDCARIAYNLLKSLESQNQGQEQPGQEQPGEQPADKPVSENQKELEDFAGNLFGVIQGTNYMENNKGEAVPGVEFLLGKVFTGDIPCANDSTVKNAVQALDEEDYLNGQLYVLKVNDSVIKKFASVADSPTWVKKADEIDEGVRNASGFATVADKESNGLITLAGDDAAGIPSCCLEISDEHFVVYLIKTNDDDESYYEVGSFSSLRKGDLVRLYDVTDDKEDSINILIIDKRDN